MSLNDVMKAHADAFRSKTGVTSKLSISTMTKLLNNLSWKLQKNLIENSGDSYVNVDLSGWAVSNYLRQIKATNDMIGKNYTYSVTIKNGNDTKVRPVGYCMNGNTKLETNPGTDEVDLNEEKDVSLSFPILKGTAYIRVDVEAVDSTHQQVRYSYKNERLYEGTDPGAWTPNPADIVGGGN